MNLTKGFRALEFINVTIPSLNSKAFNFLHIISELLHKCIKQMKRYIINHNI